MNLKTIVTDIFSVWCSISIRLQFGLNDTDCTKKFFFEMISFEEKKSQLNELKGKEAMA